MSRFLLLLLAAIYFIRPYEWVPGLIGMPLFLWAVLPCIAISIPSWSPLLNSRSFQDYPISTCVLGLLVVSLLSTIVNGCGLDFIIGFSKSCIFYFLLVGILDTEARLERFYQGLAVILLSMALLVILNNRGILSIDSMSNMVAGTSVRLEAAGANFDSNDTAALLVLGIIIALHSALVARPWILRPLWLAGAGVMVYTLQLTDSRGGFLAFVVGLFVYIGVRWGRKGLLWGLCLVPLIAAKVATERMAGIGSAFTNDTGQNRIQFWCDGLLLLKYHPIFGIGPNQFVAYVGKAAHNTFIEAYAELGFLGGTLFLGAFAYALFAHYRLARTDVVATESMPEADPSFLEAPIGAADTATHPTHDQIPNAALICALLAGYGVAILGLNHLYGLHTYLLLGLATVSTRIYGCQGTIPASTLAARFCFISVAFVISSHIVAQASRELVTGHCFPPGARACSLRHYPPPDVALAEDTVDSVVNHGPHVQTVRFLTTVPSRSLV